MNVLIVNCPKLAYRRVQRVFDLRTDRVISQALKMLPTDDEYNVDIIGQLDGVLGFTFKGKYIADYEAWVQEVDEPLER